MAKTRWLDEDEQRTWRTFMVATQLLFDQLHRELERGTSVPGQYYEVLVRLSEAPGRRLRMSELADRSQSSRSRLSHTIARLEEEGWVCRERCPSDRRGSFAVLTDAGFGALEAAAPVHVDGVRTHLFDQLSAAQLDELRTISEQILNHLVALNGSSPEDLGLLGILGECGVPVIPTVKTS
jgi:DNA-binding MarR family transcriptional regulator